MNKTTLNTTDITKLKTWLFSLHNVAELRSVLTTFLIKKDIWILEKDKVRLNSTQIPKNLKAQAQKWTESFFASEEQTLKLRNKLFLLGECLEELNDHKEWPIEGFFFRDLRGVPCPNNLIKVKMELKKIPKGSFLEVWLDKGQPLENVPRGLRGEGFQKLQVKSGKNYGVLTLQNQQIPPT